MLLADDGRVKVADFGLARAINSDTQHTATGGVLIGTVSYLSPELVVNGHADARADVYAAGVLIYEMLTGHKPHQAESPIQVAYKHVHEDIPPPSASTPGIPPYVDALVARATARDTALRPADAGVLLHQVRRVRNALDHGVTSDADLMEDLTPTTPVGLRHTPTGELPAQIIEPEELSYLDHQRVDDVYDHERDSAVLPPAPPRQHPVVAPTPGRPADPPRRSRRGPVLLTVVLALAVLAALGGWYLGFARYTTTPGVLNLSRGSRSAPSWTGTAWRWRSPKRPTPRRSGRASSSRPLPGPVTACARTAPSRRSSRWDPNGTRSPTSAATPSTTPSRHSTRRAWSTAMPSTATTGSCPRAG